MAISEWNMVISDKGEELVEHGSTLFPLACYHDDLHRDPVPWHWHEELEFVKVSEGEALVEESSEKYTVKAGSGFFINSEVLHAVWPAIPETCKLHSLVFKPRLVAGGLESVFWQKYLQPLINDQSKKTLILESEIEWQNTAISLIEDAWQTMAKEPPGYEFKLRNILSELVFIFTQQMSASPRHLSEKEQRDETRIKKMLSYIQNNYSEPLSCAVIAQSAMISESECLRCFRSTIGIAPIQYLKRFRIQKAADFLAESSLSVSEVAERCGFMEMSYFAKSFKDLRGMTPSEFRKEKLAKRRVG